MCDRSGGDAKKLLICVVGKCVKFHNVEHRSEILLISLDLPSEILLILVTFFFLRSTF